ncbi:MAG: response regulator [Magnetococcales bacterium]|nr:response regulator [Magnetococcales bacterium]
MAASENHLPLLLESCPDDIFELDPQGNLVFINHPASGVTREAMLGTPLTRWLDPGCHADYQVALARTLASGTATAFVAAGLTPGRRQDAFLKPLLKDGQVLGVACIARVIEDPPAPQHDALRHSNALLEQLFNTPHLAIAFLDQQFCFIRVNRSYAEACGCSPDFFPGQNHFALFPNPENEAIFNRVVASGEPFTIFAKPFEFPDHPEWGITYWDWTLHPVKDAQNTVSWLIFMLRDVTASKRTEADLIQAKLAADTASRAKSDFLAAMSHEIRTPMNVVIGMSDVLMESALDAQQRDCVRRLQKAGSSLLELIGQFLDLSRIEAGEMRVQAEPLNPRELLGDMVDLMGGLVADKGLTLDWKVDPALPQWLIGDQARLAQVLFNLLGNAVKFTEQGGIALRALVPRDQSQIWRLSVRDSGIGIAAEQQKILFGMFTQGNPGITRRYGGTGLGLFLSRRLVELMGGSIGVESILHQGSLFHVELPLRPADPPCPIPLATARPAGTAPLRILLVEDSEDNQILIHTFLKSTPHHLEIAVNGAEAVQRTDREPFDLVFMDVQMPIMDGYTATGLIRQRELQEGRPRLPIASLTAHALEGEEEKSRAAGCDLYLIKPIRKQRLLQAIRELVEKPAEIHDPVE